MKKINLITALAVIALFATSIMAHQLTYNTVNKELTKDINTLIQTDITDQHNDTELEIVKKDLNAIRWLNHIYLGFLNEKDFSKHNEELNNLGNAILAIKDESVRNAYKDTFNAIKYKTRKGYLSLQEIHLKFNDMRDTKGLDLPGMDFLITYTNNQSVVLIPHPTQYATGYFYAPFIQHGKFLEFLRDSDYPKNISREKIAQKLLTEIDNLGKAVNKLPKGDFKDSYIKTLNTIKYYFAYDNKVYTLKELISFAGIHTKSNPYNLKGIKTFIIKDKTTWLQSFVETMQHEK